uniref:Uncharacterized protein n=1 Tax=Arundo donax TaxID=35708 RepID=A0A0A9F1F7_ARUDO
MERTGSIAQRIGLVDRFLFLMFFAFLFFSAHLLRVNKEPEMANNLLLCVNGDG